MLILQLPYMIENINSKNYLKSQQSEINIINVLAAIFNGILNVHT